jgi:hypothetical protein
MEMTVHHQVLGAVFVMAAILGAAVSKTSICTMGAVSDWVNMGDTVRLRAWLPAMAVAIAGVTALQSSGSVAYLMLRTAFHETVFASRIGPTGSADEAWLRGSGSPVVG